MTDAAEKLGYGQNHITQIEYGKTNPTPEFLEKCFEVYKIPEIEKADFFAQALVSSNRLIFKLNKATIIPRDDLSKLMAVLVFNLEEPYPATKEWEAVAKAINRLKEGINNRGKKYTIIS